MNHSDCQSMSSSIRKTLIQVILFGFLALSIAGCGGSSSADESATKRAGSPINASRCMSSKRRWR